MFFASIDPSYLRTNPWNFGEKYWELAVLKNSVFLSQPFWFFFQKKTFVKFESGACWAIGVMASCQRLGIELVSKELNHFGMIADLFRQIGGHSSIFVLFCFFWRFFTIKMIKSVKLFPFSFQKVITKKKILLHKIQTPGINMQNGRQVI